MITKIQWDAAKPGVPAWFDEVPTLVTKKDWDGMKEKLEDVMDRKQTGLYVYVAGPIVGTGNPDEKIGNVWKGMRAALDLIEAGHYPICPHLSYFLNKGRELPRKLWLALGKAQIDRCDTVIRLPGISKGADGEVMHAHATGMIVYYGVDAFLNAAYNGEVHRFRPVELPTRDDTAPPWNKGDKFPGYLYGFPIIWREEGTMEDRNDYVWRLVLRRSMSGYEWEGKPDQPPLPMIQPVSKRMPHWFADDPEMRGSVEDQPTEWGHLKYLGGWPILWERDEKLETRSAYAWELRRTYEHLQLVGDKYVEVIDTTPPTDDPEMRERLAVPEVVNTAATPTVCSTCGVVNCNLIGRRKEGAECFAWIERTPIVEWEIRKARCGPVMSSATIMAGVQLVSERRELKAEAARQGEELKRLRKELGMLTGERDQAVEDRRKVTFVYQDSSEVTDLKYALKVAREDRDKFVGKYELSEKALGHQASIALTADSERRKALHAWGAAKMSRDSMTVERDNLLESIACGNRIEVNRNTADMKRLSEAVAARNEMERQRDLFVKARDAAVNLVDQVMAKHDETKELWSADHFKLQRQIGTLTRQRDTATTQRSSLRKQLGNMSARLVAKGDVLRGCKERLATVRVSHVDALKFACRRICPFRRR